MKEGLGVGPVAVPPPFLAGLEKVAEVGKPRPCAFVFVRFIVHDGALVR